MTSSCTPDNMTPLLTRMGCFLAILTLALLVQPGAVAARAATGARGHSQPMLQYRHLLQTKSTSNTTSNSTSNSTNTTGVLPSNTTLSPSPSPDPNADNGNTDYGDGISNQQLISNQQVNLSPGAVAGIVIGCIVAGVLVIGGTVFVFLRFRRHGGMNQTGSGAPGTTNPRLNLPELNALHDLTKAGGDQQVSRAPGI